MSETVKLTIKEKRGKLIDLSAQVHQMVKFGKYANTNEAVVEFFYKKDGHNEFHTFWQWIEKGYRVKKGETAFYVWAKPLSKLQEEKGIEAGDEQVKYFPLCFLFSNMQVEKIQPK